MARPNSSPRPARRGYLILLGLIVTGIVIFNLDAIRDLTRRHIEVVALLPDAPAIRVGTVVRAEGVRVGRVEGVEIAKIRDTAFIALDLRLERRARAVVTGNSDVRASRQRFIGEPVIHLFAGNPGDPPLRAGDTIRGRPQPAPEELLARAEALPHALDSLMADARLIQASLERAEPRVRGLMEQLRVTGDAVAAFGDQLEAGSLGRMFDQQTGLPPRIRTLQLRVHELQLAAADLGERYGADGELATRIDGLTARATAIEAALTQLEARMEEGGGFVWRMQADTALDVAIRGVQLQIDSLMAEALSIALRMFLP